ncbi:MAGUK p55 subfamily member 6 isoform X1 [Brachionus plicatilis]|uniref:MAGUK p55 subfamily member 6 isoform X1 n=1 Tax=Brachionus plicatilis TaxID=10195 RepID=A0A3M7SYQ7_BRAPC|nr:MAGUK p55 subfamily member 6 isoform X1 [Brachionus plicatilis]
MPIQNNYMQPENSSREPQQFGDNQHFTATAHQYICSNLANLASSVEPNKQDFKFLQVFLNSPALKELIDCFDTIVNTQDVSLQPENKDNISLIKYVLNDLEPLSDRNRDVAELYKIFLSPNVKSLIEAHDTIAEQDYDNDENILDNILKKQELENEGPDELSQLPYYASPPIDAIRMIGIRKVNDEPLGITVRINENGDLEIARIMHGGMIDKQGLLHEGDIIKEVNGQSVSTPEELQEKLKEAKGSITLKVVPSYYEIPLASQVYMKALFNYDPNKDKLIPAKAAGLSFLEGDVLQIISQEDIHWWQARNLKTNQKGLIPSLYLEERRKAFVPHEHDFSQSSWVCGLIDRKKKKKILFSAKDHAILDKADLKLYEEVASMPPFQRKSLVLIGAEGIGRRTLKIKLMNLDPDKFGITIPHTSRAMRENEENGRGYFFEDRQVMEADIKKGEYLEWGEYNGNLYGTKLNTIRQVIQTGKMCIIDCSPKALKLLSNQEFMPYIVFIKCPPTVDDLYSMKLKSLNPSKFKNVTINQSILNIDESEFFSVIEDSETIERDYHAYFDLTIMNEEMGRSFNSLVEAIDALKAEPQWVPVNWLY